MYISRDLWSLFALIVLEASARTWIDVDSIAHENDWWTKVNSVLVPFKRETGLEGRRFMKIRCS